MSVKTEVRLTELGVPPTRDASGLRRRDRGLRRGLPAVTVVVVATWDGDRCFASLADLAEECGRGDVELLVVCARPCPEIPLGQLERVGRRIVAPDGASADDLRMLGMSAAKGDIVAIIDDPADLDPGWVERLRSRGRALIPERTRGDQAAAGR